MKRIKHIAAYTIIAIAMLSACQETLEQRCQREAHTYTEKNCPALIAKDVTIDSLTFDKQSHTLCYAYTLGGVLILSILIEQIFKKESLGGGDVKLIAVMGLYLGMNLSLYALFFACIFGLVILLISYKSREGKGGVIPFGPALAAATMLMVLWGQVP